MVAIARGQENTTSLINWFIRVGYILVDAYDVGFQVWDVIAGLPGSQVFPATPGDWEEVTSPPGNFSVGSYYAYDNGNTQGWTPSIAEPLGTHQVKWRWKITAGSPYQSNLEEFEVLAESAGGSEDYYCSVADIRAVGLDVSIADDATVLDSISTWQPLLDRACRQWFNYRTLTLLVDGNDSDTLFFGVPIVTIEYLKLNGSTEELNTDLYLVYNSNPYPDDRHNPKICLYGDASSIFTSWRGRGRMIFSRGRQNHEIKGIFGYTESNGIVPKLIKRALIKLVVEKLTSPVYSPGDVPVPPVLGAIIMEKTDLHMTKYGHPGGEISKRRSGLSGITQDPEILDIIKMYRAPIGLATPVDWR